MKVKIDVEKTQQALKSYLKNILEDYKLLKKQGLTDKEIEEFLSYSFESLNNWASFGFALEV